MAQLDIKGLELKFNELTLRERVISFGALLLCTLFLTYFWMWEPATIQMNKDEKALISQEKKQTALKNEIAQIKLKLKSDPLKIINKEIDVLNKNLATLDDGLNQRLVKFIQANKMSVALTKVLAKTPGLKINHLKTLPVQAFNSNASSAKTDSEETLFYKHTLEIEVTGSYNAVYHYLANLEAWQDKFYWESLKYDVTDYPLANITLQIYTLSDQQELVSG